MNGSASVWTLLGASRLLRRISLHGPVVGCKPSGQRRQDRLRPRLRELGIIPQRATKQSHGTGTKCQISSTRLELDGLRFSRILSSFARSQRVAQNMRPMARNDEAGETDSKSSHSEAVVDLSDPPRIESPQRL